MYQAFVNELKRQDVSPNHRLTSTSCLGPCASGATVFMHPDGTVYGGVTPEDVPEIIQRHVLQGEPVARLVVPDN